ncbi:hypothetical protein DXG03_006985 [Asterophora parasitica]|uniref:Uncharacterized protein n=1 Tax=Asterophora parasitica TaxID=117018 RepID=A0A9P7KDF5_9AGAR|nr:hypothetical protein DXG03_006985 [Asterophora parasitica]
MTEVTDWIAHGMLDSIVDSFFPLLEEIGREVVAIEEVALITTPFPTLPQLDNPPTPVQRPRELDEKRLTSIDSLAIEKHSMLSLDYAKPRFSPPRLTFPLVLRRLKRFIIAKWRLLRKARTRTQPIPKYATLRRMARARRLVTSLTRLLATKLEVVAQIRKRLLTSSHGSNDNVDVAIYMGDVQGM